MLLSVLRICIILWATCFFVSCISSKKTAHTQPAANITSLHFLGKYQIPYAYHYKNTTVGGLSGIDYNSAEKMYYLICDDRSAIHPARFYTAAIFISQKGIDSVIFNGVFSLLQPNGKHYPNFNQDPIHAPDPEAIRFNPTTNQLVWSSEGERIVNTQDTILANPAIHSISVTGTYIHSFLLPDNLEMQLIEEGPRQNGVLEGMTFADNYKTLVVSLEEPLYEDGPRAENFDNNAYIRLVKFNIADRKNTHQYAYKLAPVAHPPFPVGSFKVNGATDILSIGKNKFLVTERSFSTGRLASTVKVFIADLNKATNIKHIQSLNNNTHFVPAHKQLLLNMDDLGFHIDNVEGVTFGPTLPNGNKTLIFVTDNNFNVIQKTQLLLFEVNE